MSTRISHRYLKRTSEKINSLSYLANLLLPPLFLYLDKRYISPKYGTNNSLFLPTPPISIQSPKFLTLALPITLISSSAITTILIITIIHCGTTGYGTTASIHLTGFTTSILVPHPLTHSPHCSHSDLSHSCVTLCLKSFQNFPLSLE